MFRIEEPAKQFCEVLGKKMAYSELGSGPPVVLLHGNPASSYIWRNIMPHAAPQARCIAPDLIGMGDSEKLEGTDPDRYGFLQHRRFVDGLLEKLNVTNDIVLVGHDWGRALAMDWARLFPLESSQVAMDFGSIPSTRGSPDAYVHSWGKFLPGCKPEAPKR
jgi:haloalkane dehalogenase